MGVREPCSKATSLRSLCVFCGSSAGRDMMYVETARFLGRRLAREGIRLVYGGGSAGIMGALADAVLEEGGAVTGVIPRHLFERELGHRGLTALHVVEGMHERKRLMADLAEGFVALPGGLGTLEELFEVWTWAQLGIHQKPVCMLNVGGFFDPMIRCFDHLVDERFVAPAHREILVIEAAVEPLFARLRSCQFSSPLRKSTHNESKLLSCR